MKVEVLTQTGEQTGRTVDLDAEVFGIKPNSHAIYLDIKAIQANRRQGTHQTKERGEIVGSTRKIRKQKGLGAARVGSIKNPLFRSGGRTFGPVPRDYNQKVNKQLKRLARKSALSLKAEQKEVLIVESLDFEEPKTKRFNQLLKDLGIPDKKTLVVLEKQNSRVYLASRNLKQAHVLVNDELNTRAITHAEYLVVEEKSLNKIESTLKK